MSRVVFQIGYCNSGKKNQSISAFINDCKVAWGDDSGFYLTTHKDRILKNMVWYMYEADLGVEDVLTLKVETFLKGIGKDHELTFDILYYPDDTAPIKSVEMSNVGMRGYPLVKGRLLEISSVSADDERKREIDDFLNKEF